MMYLTLNGLSAQSEFHTGFEDPMETYYPKTKKEDAVYVTQTQQVQWVNGISGRALDLSASAVLRKPLILDSLASPLYDSSKDLSVQIWVRTVEDAPLGTPIIGNLPDHDKDAAGWKIYSQDNGAWAVYLSDGEKTFIYRPLAIRQAINDGKWHQLGFNLNRSKEEVWFFKDGVNVAIYNVPGLGDLTSNNKTVIGGSDEYWEYGSMGQWMAFNGFIDEVTIGNSFQDKDKIQKDYQRFRDLKEPEFQITSLRTMVWNIWHGGRRYGKHVGVHRVVETIKSAQPDVVALIETYGSGEIIADQLGYYFYLISSNLSILSRFPIEETITAFKPFNFGGAKIHLGNGRNLVCLNTWLHYLPNYGKNIVEGKMQVHELISGEGETRHDEIKSILSEIKPLLQNSDNEPLIMLGDFNSGSHLDWIPTTKDNHYGYVIEWPVSKEMYKAGFKDSYREFNYNPLMDPGLTWTPRAATTSDKYGLRDRIDYIYYRGKLNPIESKVIDYHSIMFPSDHAAVITVFELN